MTITWLNENRAGQKAGISTLLDKLYQGQDTTIPGTYIGSTTPVDSDFNDAWSNKLGYNAQPVVGSPVQWYDPDLGLIRDHYSKVPESGVLSSGIYHQHGYVDPRPWSKHVKTIHADGIQTSYDIGILANDFPTDYYDLVVVGSLLVPPSAGSISSLSVRKNGYSGNTHVFYYWGQRGTGVTTQATGTTTSLLATLSVSRATKLFSGMKLIIPDYAGNRDDRSIWLNMKNTSVSPLDDAVLGDDINIAYGGAIDAVVGVIDSSGITVTNPGGVAFQKGTVISVYVCNPVPL